LPWKSLMPINFRWTGVAAGITGGASGTPGDAEQPVSKRAMSSFDFMVFL